MNMKKIVFFLLILSVFFPQVMEAQCAMCRAVLESDSDTSAAKGVNDGIVYLMAIPYVLIGGVFFVIYRNLKS